MLPGSLIAALLACAPVDDIPDRLAVPVAAVVAGPQKVSGAWTRDTEMTRMTFAFGETRLTIALTFAPPEGANVPGFTATLDADYAVSPEGVVYGVITGGDAEPSCVGAAVQLVVGHPFALRARTDGTVTTIRDVKFFGASVPSHTPTKKEPKGIEEMTLAEAVAAVVAMTAGRYTADDGTKKPMKKASAATTTTTPAGMTLGVLGPVRGTGTVEAATPQPVPTPAQVRELAGPPPEYYPADQFPNGPPARLPTPPNLPPVTAAPVQPPPVAPAGFVSPAPNVGPPPPADRPPRFGGIPLTPPPVPVLTAPTAVEKAVAEAMAKLGTDPGIPAYYEMLVKEVDGVSVTMTWTANTFVNRVYFDIQTATGEGEKVARERFRISANFACGKDGVFYGVITDVDMEHEERALTRALKGALFKFTQKEIDGKMATRDVVVLSATGEKAGLDAVAEALAGRYTGSPGKPAGPPKPVPGRHVPGKASKE